MATSGRPQIRFCLPATGLSGYGDALFENIHAWSTEAQFLEKHYSRLTGSMAMLGMTVPERFTLPHFRGSSPSCSTGTRSSVARKSG